MCAYNNKNTELFVTKSINMVLVLFGRNLIKMLFIYYLILQIFGTADFPIPLKTSCF